jgi:RsiW-degrading membrane proteinase PrsW (M82 family)
MSFILAVLSALLPVVFWYFIIIRKERRAMKFFFFLVFFIAMVFAYFFKSYEHRIFVFSQQYLGFFLSFFVIGMLIEYGKNFIIRIIGRNYFNSIDDVVDLAFATALGFTFMENIFIFYDLFQQPLEYGTPIEVTKKIIFQEFFILPIHLFCSGIFGYYYGLALFAKKSVRTGLFYSTRQILKGTLISTITYGTFFFLKEEDLELVDVAAFFGYYNFPINERLIPIISYVFFSAGSLFLFHLLEHKHFLVEENPEKKP